MLFPLPGRMRGSRHPSPNRQLQQALHPCCHDNRLLITLYNTVNLQALLGESWKEEPSICPLKIRRLFFYEDNEGKNRKQKKKKQVTKHRIY